MSLITRDVGPAHKSAVKEVLLSKGGIRLVSFDATGAVYLYEMASKVTRDGSLCKPSTPKPPIWMDEGGGLLVTTKPSVIVHDLDSMKTVSTRQNQQNITATAVAMLDENRVVICDTEGGVTLWDIHNTDKDTCEQELSYGDHVKQDAANHVVAIATHNNKIYANTRRASILTWDLDIGVEAISGVATYVDTTTDASAVPFLAVSDDEKFGVVSMAKVSVLNLEAGYKEGEFHQNDADGYATCYEMRENEIVIGYSQGSCILWGFRPKHRSWLVRVAIGTPEPYSSGCLAVSLSRDQSKMFAVRKALNSCDMFISTYDLKVQEKRAVSLFLMHWMRLHRETAFNIMTSQIVDFLVTAEPELLPGQLARVRCIDDPGLVIAACIVGIQKKTEKAPEFCDVVTLPLCEPVPKCLADIANKKLCVRTTDLSPMPESDISKMEETKQREMRFDLQNLARSYDPRLRDKIVAEIGCDPIEASRALRQCQFSISEAINLLRSNKRVKPDNLEKLIPVEYDNDDNVDCYYEDDDDGDGDDDCNIDDDSSDGGGLVEMPSF